MSTSGNSKLWRAPGRPWELVLLVLVFFMASLILPGFIQQQAPPVKQVKLLGQVKAEVSPIAHFINREEAPWLLVTVVLFFGYLFVPNPLLTRVNLPIFDLVAPFLFGLIAYVRILRASIKSRVQIPFVEGQVPDILLWIAGLLLLTLLAVVLNVTRHRFKWRKVRWDIKTPTTKDGTLRRLLVNLYPLFYPPREYRICPDGILVSGWHYLLSIPITAIESVRLERKANPATFISENAYLATSTKQLLRLGVKGFHKPIFISPKKSSAFLMYIRIARSQKKKAA